jgi:hypothetical protein
MDAKMSMPTFMIYTHLFGARIRLKVLHSIARGIAPSEQNCSQRLQKRRSLVPLRLTLAPDLLTTSASLNIR